MSGEAPARDPYLVKSVVHASRLLSAFRSTGEALPLREIASRSGLPKSMTFRLLYTLERCGMVEKAGENLYRSHLRPFKQRPFRLGYAAQGTDYQFSTEFSTDEHIAPIVASKYREAGIPLIAIEVPHPGATYFGANNYEAGLIGGRHLGRWAKQHWHADLNEIVLLALERAGSLPKMRLTGMLVGMKEICPQLENCQVTYLEGDGKLGESFEAMRRHLRTTRAKRFLIGAINDPSALGALRALQEAGRSESCAIMGQNASPEGRAELRVPGTRLIGSVAYFPEKYGAEIVAVALDILHRRSVPPAVFVKHQLVTPDTVDHIYPNDHLMQVTATTV